MEKLDPIESRIQLELLAMCADPKWKDNRTSRIKKAIRKAVEPTYHFTATIPEEAPGSGRREWMWDAVAWEEQPEPGMTGWIRSLKLVAESELGSGDNAEEDFQRLIVARADYRLLVFDRRIRQNAEETIDRCMRAVRNFWGTQKGDRYLFACWIHQPQEQFEFWLRVA